MANTITSVTKANREIDSLRGRLSKIRSQAKQSGEVVQSTAMRVAGAMGSSYIAVKWAKDGKAWEPFGLPAPLALGVASFGIGILSDSQPIREIGEGALIAAAAKFGESMAVKAK